MCDLLLKAVPAWGQTRWPRALSSQVLKASKNGNFTALLAACSTAWASSWENSFPCTQCESLLYSLCLLSLILPPISLKNLALPFGAFTITGLFIPTWRVCIDPYWISYGSCWPFSLSRSLWMAGPSSSYRQTAPGNWCHLKTWQKHAPSPPPGHW